jgi:hypothetical protein
MAASHMQRPKVGTQCGHPVAAQFAVASELCKRGYEAPFTMGNTAPVADLMVVGPSGSLKERLRIARP